MLADLLWSPMPTFLLAIVLTVLGHHFFSSRQDGRKEPPGPTPVPLLGNLLQLDLKELHTSLFELSKQYGSVFTVYLGPVRMVVLAGYSTVREALVNYAVDFGDREISQFFYDLNKGHGIVFSNGEAWREIRRFTLSTLRDFGMGKRLSEKRITEECRYLIEEFQHHEGKPFNNASVMSYASCNIISGILFGERFDYKDPKLQTMISHNHELTNLAGSVPIQIYNFFPWCGRWLKSWESAMRLFDAGLEDIRRIVQNLKESLNPETCRCFVDAFLTRKNNLEESGIMDKHFHDDNLLHTAHTLFAAGTESTGHTLRWSLLFMAKYPHIQDRVQEELSRVVGSRQVRVEDRRNLPYTDAVIHETQRLANVAPVAVPHQTSRDVTFQGHFIRKGTVVIPLLTSVLYDDTQWEEPHTFNPSHFLDEEGKFRKRDAFLPFSAGRRVCVGEGLARMELFLFFTSLLQHFRFTPPPGVLEDDLDLTPAVSFILSPLPHELCALRRL